MGKNVKAFLSGHEKSIKGLKSNLVGSFYTDYNDEIYPSLFVREEDYLKVIYNGIIYLVENDIDDIYWVSLSGRRYLELNEIYDKCCKAAEERRDLTAEDVLQAEKEIENKDRSK